MSLRLSLFAILGFLLLSLPVWPQELPTKNPQEVWVKGRKVSHSWRDGRILVATSDLRYLLGTQSDFPQVDLLKALEENGDYTWKIEGQKFVAKRKTPKATNFDPEVARRRNAEYVRRSQEIRERARAEELARPAPQGNLVYSVEIEPVDFDFYVIHLFVKNDSSAVSHEHSAVYSIPASYQNPSLELQQVIPPLAPGQIFPFQPIPFENDVPPAVYLINMNFFNLVNDRDDPKSRWDLRKQARSRKRNRL